MSTTRTFHGARRPRMLSNEVVDTDKVDSAARQAVFQFGAPKVVLIKINTKRTLGLPLSVPAQTASDKVEGHRVVAARFGIDCEAYRDGAGLVHNGHHYYENEYGVRIDSLVEDLIAAGYRLTGQIRFQKPARQGGRPTDPTLQLVFALEGEEVEMSAEVREFIGTVRIGGFHLWCNPKMAADGTPWRLDTLNGYDVQGEKGSGQTLTYSPPEPGESGYDM